MDVEFFSSNPRQKARQKLDDILSKGVDQLAIACAFCTEAGVQILKKHTPLLKNPNSFVVVSVQPPTDYEALGDLHRSIPMNLFVHWGMLSPVEVKGGAALMHSKLFYARAGNECWLWNGSHNLTGNATQGGNCEAAVLLHGSCHEKPFMDALMHLEACKSESTLYDPDAEPPGGPERADILTIHVEANTVPVDTLPWHIHLCLNTSQFDEDLSPPTAVRVIIYAKGSLKGGWIHAVPLAAYEGALTGQNLTARNPNAGRIGVPAEWRAATFGITEIGGIPTLGPDSPLDAGVMTQAVMNVTGRSDENEILMSEKPGIAKERIEGEASLIPVDPDMTRFFRRSSVVSEQLVRIPYTGRRFFIAARADETRERDLPKLRTLLAPDRAIEFDLKASPETSVKPRHPFIIKTRYRVRD